MCVANKIHNVLLVKVQPEERLATTSELNSLSSRVIGCGGVRGVGHRAVAQVKGFSPEIFIASEVDVVHLAEGHTLIDRLRMTTKRDS